MHVGVRLGPFAYGTEVLIASAVVVIVIPTLVMCLKMAFHINVSKERERPAE